MNIYSGRMKRGTRDMVLWGRLKRHPFGRHASLHQTEVRFRYPKAFWESDITTLVLADWLMEHKDDKCPYCGNPANSIDHIAPLGNGGTHTWANIEKICKPCNSSKHLSKKGEFLHYMYDSHSIR